ncbi:MAG TPA: DUF309 domain-containing protein [Chthonomonadales bacterium]|nr:DUF309 domain-containing protein [Chthonomonadales bacterium]
MLTRAGNDLSLPSTGEGAGWPEQLPEEFHLAMLQLEAGSFFQCHETLEAIWRSERGPVRELYQGIIQIAVGCYHLTQRKNWVGAVNKLEQGAARLERTAVSEAYGVAWKELIAAANRLSAHLHELGRERVSEYDPALLPNSSYSLYRPAPLAKPHGR